MNNIQIRKMTYDDIPFICKADNDESEGNIQYLKKNVGYVVIEWNRITRKRGL